MNFEPIKYANNDKIYFSSLSRPEKNYVIDPQFLLKNQEVLGQGTSGKVVKAHLTVITGSIVKEKHCAIKIIQGKWGNEYEANLEIHRRIKENHQQLLDLGITPGTGIEKMPLSSFDHGFESCLVKKLYKMDLNRAIKEGLFTDAKLLIEGSKQILEGLLTLMHIEALVFDIKPANILVFRKDKFELAFTDFEQLSFFQSKEENAEIINKTMIRMPPFLAHEEEHAALEKLKHNSAEEFVARLHKLYSFALGALFFEMTTQISLRKFIFLQYFANHLADELASKEEIEHFWKKGRQIDEKNYPSLGETLAPKYKQAYGMHLYYASRYPEVKLLKTTPLQKALEDLLCRSEAPKPYLDLVLALLNTDWESRIDIKTALMKIKTL